MKGRLGSSGNVHQQIQAYLSSTVDYLTSDSLRFISFRHEYSVLNRFIFFHFPWAFPWFLELICWVLKVTARQELTFHWILLHHQSCAIKSSFIIGTGSTRHEIMDPQFQSVQRIYDSYLFIFISFIQEYIMRISFHLRNYSMEIEEDVYSCLYEIVN